MFILYGRIVECDQFLKSFWCKSFYISSHSCNTNKWLISYALNISQRTQDKSFGRKSNHCQYSHFTKTKSYNKYML